MPPIVRTVYYQESASPPAVASAPPNGWQSQLGQSAARVLLPAAIASGLFWCPQPIAASPSNTVTIDKWQQPLSKPVAVAKAIQSGGDPPFNTFQINTVRIDKWLVPLSIPVGVAKVVQSGGDPPFNTRQTNTATIDKWQVPLSIAVPVAKAQLGNSFVPFDTLQTNTASIDKWLVPLSMPTPVAVAQQGNAFVPLNTAQINTVRIDKWQQPLSVAVAVARPVHIPVAWVATAFAQYPLGWHQPLSVSVPVAQAKPGNSFVPFDTGQAAPAGIAGMAWSSPLSTVPYSVVYSPQQYVAAPPQFGEIAPSPVSATAVGRVYGRRDSEYGARDPRNKYLTKKRWEELLEEVRLENEALAAPTRAKKAVLAVADAERQAVRLAEQLEFAEAEQLAITLVAAERASKATDALKRADDAMKMMAEIQARIDEDEEEVLMLLLH